MSRMEPISGTAPIVIGHRGASGYRPEHTASAYRLALALGADAVEPDLVPTRDGVLVVRHDAELSETTTIASHREFADRRRTISVDGHDVDGWFSVDFTWDELSELRAVERLPELRQPSTTWDGLEPILRLGDLLDVVESAAAATGVDPVLVAEIKHAELFAALGHHMDELLVRELDGRVAGERLVIESFEMPVLQRLRDRGIDATLVFLSEELVDPAALKGVVDGVSYAKSILLAEDGHRTVSAAHDAGLLVYTWTLRPENEFLEDRHRTDQGRAAWGRWRDEYCEILETGVDGVFADHPDLVRSLI